MRSVDVIVPPTFEPITLDEAKTHCRIDPDFTAEDDLILGLISAAREWCEGFTSRAFATQGITLTLDGFPDTGGYFSRAVRMTGAPFAFPPDACGEIVLPRPPCRSIVAVTYLDQSGTSRVIDPGAYRLLGGTEGRSRLVTRVNGQWPTTFAGSGAITIEMVCGYGSTADKLPAVLKAAVKLLVSHWYNNRDAATDGAFAEIPLGVESLLTPLIWGR